MTNDATRQPTWRRKRNRLDPEAYRGPWAFGVTVSAWQRVTVFTDPAEVARCTEALESAALGHGSTIRARCFMPDHLHVLVEGSEGSNLTRFMKAFKQATSFHYRQRLGQSLWQPGYYAHIPRVEEDVGRPVECILGNPVRAALADSAVTYPSSGGTLMREMLVAT